MKESIDVDIKYFDIPRMVRDIRPPERVPGQGKYRTFAIVEKQRRFWFFKWWYGKVRTFVKGITQKDR